MSQKRDQAPSEENLETRVSLIQPTGEPTSDEFEMIRSKFIDERLADVAKPSDLFSFQLIACSDGLDSYFTRHDRETGLVRFVDDLRHGQSVLGNHDYGTFSYGSSFDADLVPAQADRPEYEAVSYRQFDDPGLRTTEWVVGKYYMVRGVELNGQKADDLIRAMQFGGVRKTSITFAASQFVCSVCTRDLLDGMWSWDGFDEDGEELCMHFPGVTYEHQGKRVLCWALMKDEELYETSMVYKNASPSSMYLRKASALAARGVLPGSEVVKLEKRLNMRLPRPGQRIWTPGTAKEDGVSKPTARHADETPDTEPAPEDAVVVEETVEETTIVEGTIEETPEEEPAEEEGTAEDRAIDSLVTASTEVARLAPGLQSAQLESVADVERRLERTLTDAGHERTVAAITARQYETRDQAINEALGEAPTPELVRSLNSRAQMGDALYGELVRDTVAARVRAQGEEGFNRDGYEKLLDQARDPEFVRDERKSWDDLTKQRFVAGRQVEPRDVQDAPASRASKLPAQPEQETADAEGQERILSSRRQK